MRGKRIQRLLVIALALLLLPLAAEGQKKRRVTPRKPVVVAPPEPEEDPRITEMRELTQQVVFIDSMVVGKDDFLHAIRLNAESGRLDKSELNPDGCVYTNEMGNKNYFSNDDASGRMQLYTQDKLGGEWSEPMPLKGLDDGLTDANYPFMMTDGTTFYFAARGEESIGGYDIFVTRYDSEGGRFLKPENIGMPFNSEANDYMYVIDEASNLGYFVTDRRQPEGRVCVYVFIPPTARRTYNLDNYSEEQLRGLADISRIADTWGDGQQRQQALERLKAASSSPAPKVANPEMTFVINDQLTYTSTSQFRSPESPALYRELTDARKRLDETCAQLEKSRTYYAKASDSDRASLRQEILQAEQQAEKLHATMKSLEKRIRNLENKAL